MSARLASCLVCVVAAVAIAFPANAFDEKVDAANPFAGVLNVPAAGPTIAISGGNPGDPFEEGHPMESGLYKSLYYSHYHALFYDVNAPVLDKLPDANDARGHPLWFDGDRGDAALAALVTGLLERSQFADLDKLFQDWSNPSDRLADGRSKLLVYGFAISHLCQVSDCWASIHQTIQHWRETRKNSSAAALAEAIYWISYAWNARGYGYADTVDADAAAVFTERLQRAQGVLAESRPYAQGTLWTKLSIDVGKNLGLPQSRLAAIFADQAAFVR